MARVYSDIIPSRVIGKELSSLYRFSPDALWLKRAMKAAHLNAVTLAALLCVSPATVRAWRKGNHAGHRPIHPKYRRKLLELLK